MNRLLGIFSIFLILFNLYGTWVLVEVERNEIRSSIKKKIKAGVSDEELFHFHFSADEYADLEWHDSHKEFRINDMFYDVVRVHETNGEYHIEAVSDEQESELFQKLDNMVTSIWNAIPDSDDTKQIISHWLKNYLSPKLKDLSRFLFNQATLNPLEKFFTNSQLVAAVWNPPK